MTTEEVAVRSSVYVNLVVPYSGDALPFLVHKGKQSSIWYDTDGWLKAGVNLDKAEVVNGTTASALGIPAFVKVGAMAL